MRASLQCARGSATAARTSRAVWSAATATTCATSTSERCGAAVRRDVSEDKTMTNEMDFGQALRVLKNGGKVTRTGWNGGIYIYLAEGSETPPGRAQFSVTVSAPEPLPIADTICMR